MLLIAFILNGVLLAYELYSCVISISTYFLDPNNYTDLIRSGLCIAYTVLYLIDFTSSSNVLLILLICATFYRGISYFSLF